MGGTLYAPWIPIGRNHSCAEQTGGDGRKQDQVARVMEFFRQDHIRDCHNQSQEGRETLEDIHDKESTVESSRLVKRVCLGAWETAPTIAIGIVRVL